MAGLFRGRASFGKRAVDFRDGYLANAVGSASASSLSERTKIAARPTREPETDPSAPNKRGCSESRSQNGANSGNGHASCGTLERQSSARFQYTTQICADGFPCRELPRCERLDFLLPSFAREVTDRIAFPPPLSKTTYSQLRLSPGTERCQP